jgi:hypothetical protein
MMDYTFDNIGKWVADLATKPKAAQFHTYARLVRDKERQEAERAILDKFNRNNARFGEKDVTIVNDDMAIVKYTSTKNETYYIPVVQDKHPSWWFQTFEGALLGAVSLLKTGSVDAAKYAGKLLEVEM